MQLTVISAQKTIFQGKVTKVTLPTELGVVTVLPNHAPLGALVKTGILSFVPKDKQENVFIKGTDFLFQDDAIFISIGNGFLYVDREHINVLVSGATVNPDSDIETLEEMKKQLEEDIKKIRLQGNLESIEKSYLSLQKLTADLHLKRMRHGKY